MIDRVGQQVGNYRLLRLVGEGGFAQVYLGEHLHLGTQAAIKILHTQLSQDDFEQFRAEARIIAHLEHPSIVRVLDFDIIEKAPYLVMSYAPNGTLRQSYPQGTRMPLKAVLEYVTQVAEALQYAHTQKIIHRDIKPENILLGRSREALLSDFGIALISQTSYSHNAANVVGTVAYMAPEQIQGKPVPASDQYSLAVIAYEWITGERPFRGTYTEIAIQHSVAQPSPLRTKLPELPSAVEAVVLTAMHKDPQYRFANVQAFATALKQAVDQMDQDEVPTAPLFYNTLPRPSQAYVSVNPVIPTISNEERDTPEPQPLETPHRHALAAASAPIIAESGKPVISRRAAVRLTGIVAASVVLSGGLTWFLLSQSHSTPVPPGPGTPTASKSTPPKSTPTPASAHPIGTTLNTYHGHTLYVYAVTWASSDGQRIASAADDQTVQDWGTYTNQKYFSYQQNGPINDVKASHDKTRLVSAGESHTVQIRDARSGALLSTYTGHAGAVYTANWSLDDRYIVSCGADRTVQVWEVASGNTIIIYRQHTAAVWSADWSPDGKSIVSGGADNTARVWDAQSGATQQVYNGHTATIRSVSWSTQNYGVVTGSEDLTAQVWNPRTGVVKTTYRGHTSLLRTASWAHASSLIATGAHDATVQIWDGLSGQHSYTYHGHNATVFDAQWSDDDKLIVSGGSDFTVQVWQAS